MSFPGDFNLMFWLEESERHLLENEARYFVLPRVHNEMVRSLLIRLAHERRVNAAYERAALPLREALEVH
jgi:hypothetical protein